MSPFQNTANNTSIALDVNTLSTTMAKADMGGDDVFAIYDAGNSAQKKTTLANLADKLAGSGLSAASGVLSTEAGATTGTGTINASDMTGAFVQSSAAVGVTTIKKETYRVRL